MPAEPDIFWGISDSTPLPGPDELLVAAGRHAVYGRIARWLIHDLRNPTQALALITELMDDQSDASDSGLVDTVREATTHVTQSLELLDRLFRAAPPAAAAGPLSVRDSLQFVAALFQTHRSAVTLEIDADSAGPLPAVRGHEHELEQILLTLLLHMLEGLDERESAIALRARHDGDGVMVTMTVRRPAHAAEEGQPDGTAGLAAARVLAARHGGSLTRHRERNEFALRLPRWSGSRS